MSDFGELTWGRVGIWPPLSLHGHSLLVAGADPLTRLPPLAYWLDPSLCEQKGAYTHNIQSWSFSSKFPVQKRKLKNIPEKFILWSSVFHKNWNLHVIYLILWNWTTEQPQAIKFNICIYLFLLFKYEKKLSKKLISDFIFNTSNECMQLKICTDIKGNQVNTMWLRGGV